MNEVHATIDAAIAEVESLRKLLKKKASKQVRTFEEQSIIKATSLAWFNKHRRVLVSFFDHEVLSDLDMLYQNILSSSQRATVRSSYITMLKSIKDQLIVLHLQNVARQASGVNPKHTSDQPPNFAPLISDLEMQQILRRRWQECTICINAGSPLAAIVMMGGLLEALLLARINRESNKALIFKASSVPTDRSGNPKPLNEWMLRTYIDVSHEMRWISRSAKDVGEVLKDYRNYIHPYKELSHGINIEIKDAIILWEVSKSISRQVIDSVL